MALTGIQIYKLLPKTNCKECGYVTCMAFAMKLATGQEELSKCPYASEEAKKQLQAASKPPMRLVTVGVGGRQIKVGGELVMYRHDKKFFNPPALVVRIKDTAPQEEIGKTAEEVSNYNVERIGITFRFDGIAIQNDSGDPSTFANCAELVRSKTDMPLILLATDPASMSAALDKVNEYKPAIYAATKDNINDMVELAKKFVCPLAVRSSQGLAELAELSERAAKAGVGDIILDTGDRSFHDSLLSFTQVRRLALMKKFEPFGYPIISFPGEGASSIDEEAILAGQHIVKYSSIIVLDHFSPAIAYSLLTLRLNIYTDPQVPLSVEERIYEIGKPSEESPILFTSNWALTYLILSSAIEATNIPTFLCVKSVGEEADVLCWCHHCLRSAQLGKLNADDTGQFIKKCGIEDRVKHRKLVIPGRAARFKAELEQALPDWEIVVGPEEPTRIMGFLPEFAEKLKKLSGNLDFGSEGDLNSKGSG